MNRTIKKIYGHLNPLKMVKSKLRNIYWRKSTKIQSGRLWCFNLERSLPPSSKLSKTKTPLQTSAAKNTGLPLPSSQLEGVLPWRSWASVFLTLPPATCCWVTAAEGWGLHFSNQLPLMELRLYCRDSALRIPGSWFFPWFIQWCFHIRRGKPRGAQITASPPSSIQILEHVCHWERSLTLSPPPAPEP